jgi:hypothetical protein
MIKNVGFSRDFESISKDIEVEFRSGGRTYRAVVTSVDSLGILRDFEPRVNKIEVEATVTLFDITANPKKPVLLGEGHRLQLRYLDYHAPSTPDTMAFTIWQPDGILVAAAHWDVVRLLGMTLVAGQIMVK